jgi:hypothetical protein
LLSLKSAWLIKLEIKRKKMKKKYIIVLIFITTILALSFSNIAGNRLNNIFQKQKNVDIVNEPIKNEPSDTSKIFFKTPSVNCGDIKWNSSIISDWLANYCIDKCNDSITSGYKFSGFIRDYHKNWSLKVTIKTDREYLQPVKFNPENGTFDGKIYFDKTNRENTPIKIILRDSNRLTLQTFIINLIE